MDIRFATTSNWSFHVVDLSIFQFCEKLLKCLHVRASTVALNQLIKDAEMADFDNRNLTIPYGAPGWGVVNRNTLFDALSIALRGSFYHALEFRWELCS